MSQLSKILRHKHFLEFNYSLLEVVGDPLETLLLCELMNEHSYYEDRNLLSADDEFYSTVKNIEKRLHMKENVQSRCMKSLVEKGLVTSTVRNFPPKRFIKINWDKIDQELQWVLNADHGSSISDETSV